MFLRPLLDIRSAVERTSTRSQFAPQFSEDDLPAGLLLVAFVAFACLVPAQADTFYHLRSGQEMWNSGSLLTRELFSWTQYGHPLPNHWWLSQLIFYGVYSLGGPILLTMVAGGMALLAILLSWQLARGSAEIRIALLVAFTGTLSEWSVRPQVFSLLLCALTIRLVRSDRLFLVPPLLVLWANLHAVVVLGVAVATIPVLDAALLDHTRLRRTLIVVFLSVAAPLATPLGVAFWPWLIKAVQVSRALDLQEYRPPLTPGMDSTMFWLLSLLLLGGLIWNRRRLLALDRPDRLVILTAIVLAPAAATSARNVPFYALAAIPALSYLIPTRVHTRHRPAGRVAWSMMTFAMAVAIAVVVVRWQNSGAALGWRPFTPQAIAAIESCPQPIYNGLYEGGQLIWFVPTHRVFVDGRVDVYPLDFLLSARNTDLRGDYQQLFSDYGIRCAVVRPDSVVERALASDASLRRIFRDGHWTVFVR